jgi:hypothetical protein
MNAWNPDVPNMYPSQSLGFLSRVAPDRININPTNVALTLRKLVKDEGCDASDPSVLARARDIVSASPPSKPSRLTKPTFGYVAMWLSEVGPRDEHSGLLNHADRFLSPEWDKGGLFYPRHDVQRDGDGNWIYMDPLSGNAAIGYARLNVPNGQRRMWEAPWTKEDVQCRAWVDGVGLGTGVDFLRGGWDDGIGGLVLTMRTWHGGDVKVNPVIKGLEKGVYGIYIDGQLSETKVVERVGDEVPVEVVVSAREVDVIVKRAS